VRGAAGSRGPDPSRRRAEAGAELQGGIAVSLNRVASLLWSLDCSDAPAEAQFEKDWKSCTARSASLRAAPGMPRDRGRSLVDRRVASTRSSGPSGSCSTGIQRLRHPERCLEPIQPPSRGSMVTLRVVAEANAVWSPRLGTRRLLRCGRRRCLPSRGNALSAGTYWHRLRPWLWCSSGCAGDLVAADESTTEFGINLGVAFTSRSA